MWTNVLWLSAGSLLLAGLGQAQSNSPQVTVERVTVLYEGKPVQARRLTVSSVLPMPLDRAWTAAKTPALLQFVAKGMIRFRAVEGELPKYWQQGQTHAVRMRVFGVVPFGGTHYLFIESVDEATHRIATQEWNRQAKIWNHDVVLRDLGNGQTYYEDSILIYGGGLTGFITAFAKRFYQHRQRRWQLVARQNLTFGTPAPAEAQPNL